MEEIPTYIHILYKDLLKYGVPVTEMACGIYSDGRQYHINDRIKVEGWAMDQKFVEVVSIQDFLYLMSYGVKYER